MFINNKKKVIIAMSGGVDSSVAAWLLQQKGYLVEGLFMKNWEEDDTKTYCNSRQDLLDTENICKSIGIPLHTANFSFEYWNRVFLPCIKEYKKGLTPNPDVICNKEIKFNIFFDFAVKVLKADYIATGHYARKYVFNQQYYLIKSIDLYKDQTYFLYKLNQKRLKNILFPVGGYTKRQIRDIAKRLNFINADKKDSMGICFIGKKNFSSFISNYINYNPGFIINEDEKIIGEHKGLFYYTIGQRKGINIMPNNSYSKPLYVIDKIIDKNLLMVGEGHNNPHLFSWGLIAKHINWINNNFSIKPIKNILFKIKIRHSFNSIPARLNLLSTDILLIKFIFPVWGVTPGQSVVIYIEDTCLGGGIITKKINFCNKKE